MDVLSKEFDEKRSRVESLSRFSDENPHQVMPISKAGILQYANSAGHVILKIFGMEVKKEIPKDCKHIAELTFKNNKNETIELEVGQHYNFFTFYPVAEQEYVNIYG
jgi:hypothetical protein